MTTRNRSFFDTNVILYAVTSPGAKADISEELIALGGVVSVQVLNEFAAVSRRKHNAPWQHVKASLESFRATLDVVPLTLETHETGVALAARYNFAIYDAMIVAAAKLAGCQTLYTEDLHNGQVLDQLKIENPFV